MNDLNSKQRQDIISALPEVEVSFTHGTEEIVITGDEARRMASYLKSDKPNITMSREALERFKNHKRVK